MSYTVGVMILRETTLVKTTKSGGPRKSASGTKKSAPQKAPVRKQMRGITTKPVSLRRLVELLGYAEAGRRVGKTATTLRTSLYRDEVTETTEKLAGHALQEIASAALIGGTRPAPDAPAPQPAPSTVMFLLSVPASKADAVTAFAAAIGADIRAA